MNNYQPEEYLTITELSSRIKFSKQSLYNMIHKGTFIKGHHYVKPTRKKILFIWSAIQQWMYNTHPCSDYEITDNPEPVKSLINI